MVEVSICLQKAPLEVDIRPQALGEAPDDEPSLWSWLADATLLSLRERFASRAAGEKPEGTEESNEPAAWAIKKIHLRKA